MSRFLKDAGEIFEAAASGSDASRALTILIHSQGQIHIVDGSESPIDSLQAEHGCETAYRVTSGAYGQVRVEGRSGSSRCILEDTKRSRTTRQESTPAERLGLFSDRPLYSVIGMLAAR